MSQVNTRYICRYTTSGGIIDIHRVLMCVRYKAHYHGKGYTPRGVRKHNMLYVCSMYTYGATLRAVGGSFTFPTVGIRTVGKQIQTI